LAAFLLSSLWKREKPEDAPLLRRLNLASPHNPGERLLRRLVIGALRKL